MCDEFIHQGLVEDKRITRRTFGLIALRRLPRLRAQQVRRRRLPRRTSRSRRRTATADAVLFAPRRPGSSRGSDVARHHGPAPRLPRHGPAAGREGYVVLVPNPFYRSKRAPVLEGPIDFGDPATRASADSAIARR